MKWQIKKFTDFQVQALYNMLKLRVDIFVVEQNCPYPELDDKDAHADTIHVCVYADTNELIAYARLLPAGLSYEQVSIGRFLVKQTARNQGLGHQLMQRCIIEIDKVWPNSDIKIGAQEHLQAFYKQHGFLTLSEPYMEDGISHVLMLREHPDA